MRAVQGAELVYGEEPLQGEARLDDGAGALRDCDGEVVVLDVDEQAGGFEVGDDLFARNEAVEAVVGRAGQVDVRRLSRMVSEGRAWRWPMAKSLGSCAGVTLTAPVPNSGCAQSSARMGISRLGPPSTALSGSEITLPMNCGVALVVRVHRDGGVAKHGLGARGGDDDGAGAIRKRIADVVELAEAVLVRDFEVGDGGLLDRGPS